MLEANDVIGRYRLHRELGGGGFGTVWLATADDGAEVAIKILHDSHVERPIVSGPSVVERFLNEASILERLRHPGLVRIVDVIDERKNGTVAYVMERLEGYGLDTLAAHLELRPLLAIFAKIAGTLDYVHRHGIIHRDVKLDNVFILGDGEPGEPTVKLIDFGVAKDEGAYFPATAHGHFAGTMYGMAPECFERALGGETQLSPAVDQWSIGVCLYMCLTGEPPFNAKEPLGLVHKIQNESPPPLKAGPGLGVSTLPTSVVRIVERCLAKKPEQRFHNARQLQDRLHDSIDELRSMSGRFADLLDEAKAHGAEPTLVLARQQVIDAGALKDDIPTSPRQRKPSFEPDVPSRRSVERTPTTRAKVQDREDSVAEADETIRPGVLPSIPADEQHATLMDLKDRSTDADALPIASDFAEDRPEPATTIDPPQLQVDEDDETIALSSAQARRASMGFAPRPPPPSPPPSPLQRPVIADAPASKERRHADGLGTPVAEPIRLSKPPPDERRMVPLAAALMFIAAAVILAFCIGIVIGRG